MQIQSTTTPGNFHDSQPYKAERRFDPYFRASGALSRPNSDSITLTFDDRQRATVADAILRETVEGVRIVSLRPVHGQRPAAPTTLDVLAALRQLPGVVQLSERPSEQGSPEAVVVHAATRVGARELQDLLRPRIEVAGGLQLDLVVEQAR